MTTRMLQRRGDAAEWTSVNPILGDGEIGFERDTGEFKLGNGAAHWNDIPYASPSAAVLATKADLVAGKVPTSQLPAITTGQTVTVADQAAMLALTAAQVQPGDIAIRTDQSGHRWLLAAADPSVLANWIALETPGGVTSVQGYSGAVVLAKADLGLGNVDNTSDINKPVSTAQAAADATKQPLAAQLTSIAGLALAGNAGKVLTVKADVSGYELDTPAAGGGGGGVVGAFHGARVYFTASQSIPTAGNIVTFDSESFDTDNFHSTSSQTSRFTIPAGMAGKYRISGLLEWSTVNGTGNRQAAVYKNGAQAAWGTTSRGDATWGGACSVETTLDLAVGDYVELFAFQNSGSNLNLQPIGAGADTRFEIEYLGNNGAVAGSTITLRSAALLLAAAFSIPHAAWTVVPFTTERWDTANLHDNATNPSRITIPVGGDGKYLFEASIDFANNTTGQRSAALFKNGAYFGYFGYGVSPAQGEVIITSAIIADAVAGDYFELAVYHTAGVALNALSGAAGTSFACNQLGAGVSAPLILTAGSSGDKPLTLKGISGQSVPLLDIQDDTGAPVFQADQRNGGFIAVGKGASAISGLNIFNANVDSKVLVVRGNTTQTANVMELQNGAGAVKIYVSPSFELNVGPNGTAITGSGGVGAMLGAQSRIINQTAVVAKGLAGQTANLMEALDSTGALKGGFDSAGRPIVSDRTAAGSGRTGGAAQALPTNPVGYFMVKSETGTTYAVPYYN